MDTTIFPFWINRLKLLIPVVFGVVPVYLITIAVFGLVPQTTDVGYQPQQPIDYSHMLHAGKLGMDCRYCHTTVDKAAFAAIPPTQTCMGCHNNIRKESTKLAPLVESYNSANNLPVPWVTVNDLPDYVYFNHSAHVTRGVGCVSCHGKVNEMEKVYQHETLSMGWCLDCHRQPEPHLRPLSEITNMDYKPTMADEGAKLRKELNINPPTNCSTCHR